jgi:DNA-binding NarL/FixJ family response regulator
MPIRVLICDDQTLVRAGFRKLLEATGDVLVIGEAADGLEAVERARDTLPDVILMDIRMPRLDGITAMQKVVEVCGPSVRILVLTTFNDDKYVFESLRSGASGFMLKDAPPEELLTAIRVIAQGDALLDPAVTRMVVAGFVRGHHRSHLLNRLEHLTDREVATLRLLASGLSNAEIADRLVISEATVKTHVGHVLTKLHVRDRVQAVVLAYESGLVES